MSQLDELAPNFRRCMTLWPSARLLASHHTALSAALESNGSGIIEFTKSFLECVCRTILRDHGATVDANYTTTHLLKEAAASVGLVHTRGQSSFNKVLSSYFKLCEAINNLRNAEGSVAHGKDGFLDDLCAHHLRILVLAADSILALLIGHAEATEPNLAHTRRPFSSFDHLNRRIDAAVSCIVEVSEPEPDDAETGPWVVMEFRTAGLDEGVTLTLRPSELLFGHDRLAYVEVLRSTPSPTQESKRERRATSSGKRRAATK